MWPATFVYFDNKYWDNDSKLEMSIQNAGLHIIDITTYPCNKLATSLQIDHTRSSYRLGFDLVLFLVHSRGAAGGKKAWDNENHVSKFKQSAFTLHS